MYIQILEDNGTRLNEIITKHLDDDIWELRPGNNCVLYFISKPYTSKNGKQEENHSFLLLSRYHIPSRFYQSGPFQSTDATPGLKRCMIESESRSDPDKDSDIFINRQAAEEVIYRQVRIITLRYKKVSNTKEENRIFKGENKWNTLQLFMIWTKDSAMQ